MEISAASPAWFRKHFNEDYLVLYSGRSLAQAEREVEFLVRQLDIRPDETVLDLCCGFGRHLQAFRERGVRAIGADLSATLLSVARRQIDSDLVCADMLELPFAGGPGGFPVLVNFFTSFGYFESRADNQRAATEMARVLRPGGRFALDLLNPEQTIRTLVPRTERRSGVFEIVEERSYDEDSKRLEKKIALRNTRSGEIREYFESVQTYSEGEIVRMLDGAGLRVGETFGDFDGSSLGPETPRMILTGERRST